MSRFDDDNKDFDKFINVTIFINGLFLIDENGEKEYV